MKKILLVFLFAPLLSFTQANKYVRQALRLQDPKAQIELLNTALKIDSKHLDALFYRGIAKYNIEDFDGAILDFTKIIFFDADADSYYNRGNCKFNLMDFDGALEDYQKAITLDPDLIGAYYNLANTKFNLEDFEGAIEDYSKVIQSFPTDYNSYSQRALAYMQIKSYKKAFKDFGACIIIKPNSESYYNRGYALLEINYYDKAKSDFVKAIELNINNTPAYFYLGVCHFLLGQFEGAINSLLVATSKDQMDYDAHLALAMSYYYVEDFEKAKTRFRRAKKILDPKLTINNASIFKDTYWKINEKSLFNDMYTKLNAL